MKTPLKIFLLFVCQITVAQQFNKQKLDTYLTTLEQHNKAMGSFAISKNSKIIYERSIGLANVNTQQKATNDTRYRVGSITKTFTSVLVLKAIENKKLAIEQRLSDFFPNIPNANIITIRKLLSHQSGIFNFTSAEDYFNWHTTQQTKERMLERIALFEPAFTPGSRTEYSNSNYVLLSYILEEIYKKPLALIIESEIVKPLKLKNTYLGGEAKTNDGEATSYQFVKEWVKEPETHLSFVSGAGALISTPTDLITFAESLFDGKLLSKESLKQMQTIERGFGLGLFTYPFYEHTGYGHSGGIDKFVSVMIYFPETKIAYARVLNGITMTANDIDIAALSAVFGKDFKIPDFTKKISDKNIEVGYEGVYTSAETPLKITIFKKDGQLMAQATGQLAFPLTEKTKDIFTFQPANIEIEFVPNEYQFIIKQRGTTTVFHKE